MLAVPCVRVDEVRITDPRRARWRAGAAALLAAAALVGSANTAPAARAAAGTLESRALGVAAAEDGAPYRYGAAGPDSFDCSGLTYYAYRQAGARLPRTAEDQYRSAQAVPRSQLTPGDLVFFHHGGYVYHVAIYAGANQVWHAPRPGTRVRRERIWTDAVWYGRP